VSHDTTWFPDRQKIMWCEEILEHAKPLGRFTLVFNKVDITIDLGVTSSARANPCLE
jgi:hypothetical protein